jgi:hypothetical protein
MTRSPAACGIAAKSCRSGESAFLKNDSLGWRITHARGGPGLFPPEVIVTVPFVQRKVLTSSDFDSLAAVTNRLLAFQHHYEALGRPFEWIFTRRDLARLLAKLTPQTAAA